jgi:hypothetical protein
VSASRPTSSTADYHFTIDSRSSVADTLLFKVHGWLLVIVIGLLAPS